LNPTLKKFVSLAVKIGVSVALLGYLFYSASQKPEFWELIHGWRHWLWLRLGVAVLLVLAAVAITVYRWQLLARTLGLEFSTREALRVGFLGYAVNLMPLGVVGGDAVKAVFLSRLNPTRKTEAVATVFVDRVIGLVALLILAALGTLVIDIDQIGQDNKSCKPSSWSSAALCTVRLWRELQPGRFCSFQGSPIPRFGLCWPGFRWWGRSFTS